MKALPKKYDTLATEQKWQHYWEAQGTYRWDENVQTREESYVIDTPPPTVSGTLHMGHIFSYTQADFIARFQRMSGKNVFYPIGFDDNGLPTERLVEKQKKVRAVDVGREKFIDMCMEVSTESRKEFKALFQSTAMSFDWTQEYHTISEHSRRISQMSFLDLVQKGKAERRLQPMLWDPVDQTAIAQAEIEEKELPSHFSDILFGIEGSDETITIGTTRPEMIPACVGIFYHPDDARYQHLNGKNAITPLFGVKVPIQPDDTVEPDKGTGIMMCCTFGDEADIDKWRKHKLPARIILNKFGKLDLAGKGWLEASEVTEALQNKKVSNADKKHPGARQIILEKLEEAGLLVKQDAITHMVKCAERSGAALEIIPTQQWFVKVLEEREALKARSAECDWYPKHMQVRMDQWIDGLSWDWCISRQRYFGVPFPVWYSKRAGEEGKILVADAADLPVNPLMDTPRGYSKDEVEPDLDVMDTWATSACSPQINAHGISPDNPLPLGEGGEHREPGEGTAYTPKQLVELARELRKNTTDAEKLLWKLIRNRQVNGLKFRRQHPIQSYVADFFCHEAGLVIELDGGQHYTDEGLSKDKKRTAAIEAEGYKVVRFSNLDILKNTEGVIENLLALTLTLSQREREQASRYELLYPADLRPQAHEIIRTWAFYTLAKSHLHANTIPWKNLMVSGWCLASDKTKMSKSKGNIIDPVKLIEQHGADAVRYWAATSKLGTDTAFSEEIIKVGKKLVTKLWNASKFVATNFDKLEGTPTTAAADVARGKISETLDIWVLSRLNQSIQKAQSAFSDYEYATARAAIEDFFWNDLCDNYLELCKTRAYGEKVTGTRQQSALYTLYHCLEGVLRLFGPIVPHVTEELYSHIFDDLHAKEGSIHARGRWPDAAAFPYNAEAEKVGVATVSILGALRKLKAEKGVSIKVPLAEACITIAEGGVDANALQPVLEDLGYTSSTEQFSFEASDDLPERVTSEDGLYSITARFAEQADVA